MTRSEASMVIEAEKEGASYAEAAERCPRAWALWSLVAMAENDLIRRREQMIEAEGGRVYAMKRFDVSALDFALGEWAQRQRDVTEEEANLVRAKLQTITGKSPEQLEADELATLPRFCR